MRPDLGRAGKWSPGCPKQSVGAAIYEVGGPGVKVLRRDHPGKPQAGLGCGRQSKNHLPAETSCAELAGARGMGLQRPDAFGQGAALSGAGRHRSRCADHRDGP